MLREKKNSVMGKPMGQWEDLSVGVEEEENDLKLMTFSILWKKKLLLLCPYVKVLYLYE